MAIKFFLALGLMAISLAGAGSVSGRGDLATARSAATQALVDITTVVGSDTAAAGSFGVERVLCPVGTVAIGGGVDVDNVLTMKVTSSAPTFPEGSDTERLIQRPDGSNPAPNGWQATVLNEAGAEQAFKVAVICAPLTSASAVVVSDTASGESFGVERVLCPNNTVAIGGGVDVDNVLTMQVTSSAPTFPDGSDTDRLIQRPNGANPMPNGWQASTLNTVNTTQDFKVAVICTQLSGGSTVVGSDSAVSGSFGVERISCPSDTVAIGGGTDLANVLIMQVTSSGPVFPPGERLISRPNGTNPDPIAWQASAYNDDTMSRELKVAVICAPHFNVFLPLALRP